MSAIKVCGTVVSVDHYKGQTKSGDDLEIWTNYVVNGGGAPVAVKVINQANPFKAGSKIDHSVNANIFRNEISFVLERVAA